MIRSRNATLAFYAGAVLSPALFVVRILARPNVHDPAPEWLPFVSWLSVIIAVAAIVLGVIGYFETKTEERSGFTRTGLAVVLGFLFAVLALLEIFGSTTVFS